MRPAVPIAGLGLFAVLVAGVAPAVGNAAHRVVPANGPVLHVAPTGSDSAAGTPTAPLRTPQGAVDRLPAGGGTVELAGGTYRRQRIVLAGRRHVVVRAAAGAAPVLDATGLVPADGLSGVVQIANSSDITVDGLRITGYRTASIAKTPAGVLVTGSGAGIRITHDRVDHLGNHNGTKGSFDIDAHGIAVYGTSAAAALRDVRIEDDEVDHLTLGASESVVVNGNVDGWRIMRNRVHDDDNIGIDAIGFEETIGGPARYSEQNRARNGVISDNRVARISAEGNPAYYQSDTKDYCRCADGVYVDGGAHIAIERNTVTASDIGIEVAAENPRGRTNAVSVTDNRISGSAYVGMTVGGYSPTRGEAYDLTVTGNTLTGDDTLRDGSPELLLQYKVHQAVFTGNRITARNDDSPLVQRVALAGTVAQNAGVALDRNSYGAPVEAADADFDWLGHDVTGFTAWRRTSGQDPHSAFTRR